jgi:hypothetical protein
MTTKFFLTKNISNILLHTIGYYIVWFSCILTSQVKPIWIGPGIAIAVSAIQLLWQKKIINKTSGLFSMVVLFVICGLIFDTLLINIGVITFGNTLHPMVAPPFMLAIWINFAILFYTVLMSLAKKYIWLSILSLLGFPLAYYSGAYLGAATISHGWFSLLAIGAVYSVVIPTTLFIYNTRIENCD